MIYSPARFNALWNSSDQSAMLQALSDEFTANAQPGDVLDLSGRWNIGTSLTLDAAGAEIIAGTFVPTAPMTSVLTVDLTQCHVRGRLAIEAGDVTYANRLAIHGVDLFRSFGTHFDQVDVQGVTRSGMRCGSDNQVNTSIGQLVARDCGSPGGALADSHPSTLAYAFTDRSDTGGDTSVTQRTEITIAGGHVLEAGDIVFIEDAPYNVDAVTATTLSLYPKVVAALGDGTGTVVAAHGGALDTVGGNTAGVGASNVFAQRCGSAIRVAGLYGPAIQQVTAEFCSLGAQVGNLRGSAIRGGRFGNMHNEGCKYDILRVTSALVIITVGNLNVPFDQANWVKLVNTTGAGGTNPADWVPGSGDGLTIVEGGGRAGPRRS